MVAEASVPAVSDGRATRTSGWEMEATMTCRKAHARAALNGCVEVGTTANGRAAGIRGSKSPERGHLAKAGARAALLTRGRTPTEGSGRPGLTPGRSRHPAGRYGRLRIVLMMRRKIVMVAMQAPPPVSTAAPGW
jgi:hypothetical protein